MLGLATAGIGAGLAKLGIGAKLASAVGMAKGLAGSAAVKGGLGTAKKFAGKALADYMGPGGLTAGNVARNFGMDIGFGLYQGAMTPGDLGDKIISGVGTGVGGAMGGVGLVSALGPMKNNAVMRMGAELGGNLIGDMGGQMASDTLLRAKGGGKTPWEKLQQEGDQQYRQQIERQMLAQLGIGGYNQTDLLG